MTTHRSERFASHGRTAVALHQQRGRVGRTCGAQAEYGFALLAARQVDTDLYRSTRVEPCTDLAGKTRAQQRGRIAQRAVATDKFLAITGKRARHLVDVEKGNPVGEFGVVGIARIECAVSRV